MSIEEMLAQLLEGQKKLQENQKMTNERLDAIQQDIEDIKEDSMITREAANHNGEVLEKLLGYLNVPVRYDDFNN